MTSGRVSESRIVVAAQVRRVLGEAIASKVRLGQVVLLDERAHGAVEHEDPARSLLVQPGRTGGPLVLCRQSRAHLNHVRTRKIKFAYQVEVTLRTTHIIPHVPECTGQVRQ